MCYAPFVRFEKVTGLRIPVFVGLCFSGGKQMNVVEGGECQDQGKKVKGNWALLEVGSWVGTTYFILFIVFFIVFKDFFFYF